MFVHLSERIAIPLKDGMIHANDVFDSCIALTQVDLVEGALHETIAALQLEEKQCECRNRFNQSDSSQYICWPPVGRL